MSGIKKDSHHSLSFFGKKCRIKWLPRLSVTDVLLKHFLLCLMEQISKHGVDFDSVLTLKSITIVHKCKTLTCCSVDVLCDVNLLN